MQKILDKVSPSLLNSARHLGKFFKTAEDAKYKTRSKPVASPKAPSIAAAKIPNIRPTPISAKDLLTTRSSSALNKTSAVKMHDWDYLKYIVKHKANMIGPGRQLGVKWSTLLKHDLDKLQPNRFRQYSDWFYGSKGLKGSKDPALHKKWRDTVDTHYQQNLHHAHKIGTPQPLENQLEALSDWYSVNKTNKQTTLRFSDWYQQNKSRLNITDDVKSVADAVVEKERG